MDVFTQQQEIERRRKLMAALEQQATSAPITGSGYGWQQALAKLGTAYVSGQKQKELAQEQTANQKLYSAQLQGEVGGYLDKFSGKPGEVMTDDMAQALMQNDQAPQLADPIRPDPRAAVAGAMSSQFPEMQGIGKAGLTDYLASQKRQAPQPISQLDYLKLSGYDPKTRVQAAMTGDMSQLQPEAKEHVVGEQIFRGNTAGGYDVAKDAREQFGAPFQRGGDWYQKDSRGKEYKLDNAPKTQVNVGAPHISVNTAENAYLKARGGDVAGQVKTLQEQAANSIGVLRGVEQLRELDAKGTFSGPTAAAAQFVSQLGQVLGIPVDSAKMANSEGYRAEVMNTFIKSMQSLGGAKGLSEKESMMVAQALPNIERSPEARRIIFGIMEARAKQSVDEYRRVQESERKAYPSEGMLNFDFGPGPTAPPGGMPMRGTTPGLPGKPPSTSNW